YVFLIYPLLLLVAAQGAITAVGRIGRHFERLTRGAASLGPLLGISCALLAANEDLSRTLAADDESLYKTHTAVLECYRDYRQPGDVLVSATPSPISTVLGGLDYYLLPALTGEVFSFDSVYMRDGRLLDRWAGGEVVSNADQLQQVLQRHKRI